MKETNDSSLHAYTLGALILCLTVYVATATDTACYNIQEIQGNGNESPLIGQVIQACNGRITSIVRNGLYIQDPSPTMDSSYSSGIFVYTGSKPDGMFATGNKLIVYGEVKEFNGDTQIDVTGDDSYYIIDPNDPSIEPIAATTLRLPVHDENDFERHEGMYVSIESSQENDIDIVISEYYNFERYGEVLVCNAEGRPYQFTEMNAPDVEGYAEYVDLIGRSCVTIDDNNDDQNPNLPLFGGIAEYEVTKDFSFRGGDVITTLKGPLFYAFSKWMIQPMEKNELSFVRSDTKRPLPPQLAPGDIKLVFSNLYNYFTDFENGRGANNEEEFIRQADKIVLALSMLDADIIAVAELENAGNIASNDLVGRLNNATSRTYDAATNAGFLSSPEVGDDIIRVDIFYDTEEVTPLNAAILTDEDVDEELLAQSPSGKIFNGLSRVPLAVTFNTTNGEVLTVVATHYKSKVNFDEAATGADLDQEDGAGYYNPTRTLTTLALAEWLSTYPTGVYTNNIIVIGDMNSYYNEDPIKAWSGEYNGGHDYYAAIDELASPRPYSYLFDGQFGSLDHAYVNSKSELELFIVDSAIWNINADEAPIHDYNLEYGRNESIFDKDQPYRFSDHDPLILSLGFIKTNIFKPEFINMK